MTTVQTLSTGVLSGFYQNVLDENYYEGSRESPSEDSVDETMNSKTLTESINSCCTNNEILQSFDNIVESTGSSDNANTKDLAIETSSDPVRLQSEDSQSFAIPEGLVMDPLAPTALSASTEFMDRIGSGLTLLRGHGKKVHKYVWKNRKFDILKKSWKSIVNIVLIEAKDLPDYSTGNIYCKIKLGNENYKSKQVAQSKPTWCGKFNLYLYEDSSLEITLWHKGKQKTFMGRCVIDVSQLDKERTHDIWQELDCGNGSLHMLVTISGTARSLTMDNVPTSTGAHLPPVAEDYSWYRLSDLSEVGQVTVTVHGARGLCAMGIGKPDPYCVVELDNARVQTHVLPGTADPIWNKNYAFTVNDVTSTVDITVYDNSPIKENLGSISIPLLRIENDTVKWYTLKSKSKKNSAKGNPQICLQMSLAYNPIKASLRVLSPKEEKYTEKPPNQFNIPLLYSNLDFIKNIFQAVCLGNEHFKYLFEWDNREVSAFALAVWVTFWFFFRMWMTPLLVLVPFIYCWITNNSTGVSVPASSSPQTIENDDEDDDEDLESKDEKTLITRLHDLKDLTFTIKNGIDYICSLIERIKNLVNFSVPYLSYLVMAAMVGLTAVLYLIPVNYLFIAFGIYKFTRKYMNPDRVPNNDILDFISRVPDDEILKQWRELPGPHVSRKGSKKLSQGH